MKMEINLPPGAYVTGELRDDFEPWELDQDILQVQMPNGYFIDVGWTPEYEKNGQYQIILFHRRWEDQKASVRTSHLIEAIKIIEDLAWIYIPSLTAAPIITKASSATVTTVYAGEGNQQYPSVMVA